MSTVVVQPRPSGRGAARDLYLEMACPRCGNVYVFYAYFPDGFSTSPCCAVSWWAKA